MSKITKKSKCSPKLMLNYKINFDMAKIRIYRKYRKSLKIIKMRIYFLYWKQNEESKLKLDRIYNHRGGVACIQHILKILYQKKKLILAEKSLAVARCSSMMPTFNRLQCQSISKNGEQVKV